jgi:hypothetical protein
MPDSALPMTNPSAQRTSAAELADRRGRERGARRAGLDRANWSSSLRRSPLEEKITRGSLRAGSMWAASASATSWASDRRSIENPARAAAAQETRALSATDACRTILQDLVAGSHEDDLCLLIADFKR